MHLGFRAHIVNVEYLDPYGIADDSLPQPHLNPHPEALTLNPTTLGLGFRV